MREQDDKCPFEKPTGDKKWPVLCDRDQKYARRDQCDECREKLRLKKEKTWQTT